MSRIFSTRFMKEASKMSKIKSMNSKLKSFEVNVVGNVRKSLVSLGGIYSIGVRRACGFQNLVWTRPYLHGQTQSIIHHSFIPRHESFINAKIWTVIAQPFQNIERLPLTFNLIFDQIYHCILFILSLPSLELYDIYCLPTYFVLNRKYSDTHGFDQKKCKIFYQSYFSRFFRCFCNLYT